MTGLDTKLERIRNGIKQYELASEAGIPQTTLSSFENDRRAFPATTAQRIRDALDRLLGRDGPQVPHGRAA